MGLPQFLSQSDKWGPQTWQQLHSTMESIPCEGCRQVGVRAMKGLHDVVNLELDKPARYPGDLQFLQQLVNEAVQRCHTRGQCSGLKCPRLERCIRDLKGRTGVNPYAVCRSRVKCSSTRTA